MASDNYRFRVLGPGVSVHLRRFIAALAAAVTLTACRGDPTGHPIRQEVPPLAYVRYFNAVGDTLPLDFRPIDQLEFSTPFLAVPYRGIGLGNYQGYAVGTRQIRVFPNSTDLATTTSVLIDTSVTLTEGLYYSIIHVGYARSGASPKQGFMVRVDTFATPGTRIALRAIHVGPDLGPVDVYATATATEALPATPLFANVSFRGVTAYALRDVGALVIRVYAAGNRTTALMTGTAPVGTAGTSLFNPIGGSGQAGTVFSVMLYSRAVPGSPAYVTSGSGVNSNPTLVYWIDKNPPATAP